MTADLRHQVEKYVNKLPLIDGLELPDNETTASLLYYKGLLFHDVIHDIANGQEIFTTERYNMGVCHGLMLCLKVPNFVDIVYGWRREAEAVASQFLEDK